MYYEGLYMDAIDAAIEKGYHINDIPEFQEQTWEEFENVAQHNRVILFGAGVGADFYLYKYGNGAKIDAVIDNNVELQNVLFRDVMWETFDYTDDKVRINKVEHLKQYNPANTVILITGLRRYSSVVPEIRKAGFDKFFSLLCMEVNSRNSRHYVQDIKKHIFRDCDYIYSKCNKCQINPNKVILYTESPGMGHDKEIVRNILMVTSNIDIVWVVNSMKDVVPFGVRRVLRGNYHAFMYELLTAKIILADTLINDDFCKKEGQYYIQVKHWGSVTLKTFGYDYARVRNDIERLKICDRNKEMMDYIMVGSSFDEKTCRSGLGFQRGAVYVGSPRSDVLFRNESLPVRKIYNVPSNAKVLLYAPTFRLYSKGWENLEVFIDLNFEQTKKVLEQKFGGTWFIFLRLHPVLKRRAISLLLPPYVINVSDYSDSEELVAISDAMITDYSSIMFEPAYVKKPVFLLATDKEKYLAEEREFLINYYSLPFSVANSNEELVENIKNFNLQRYKRELDHFMDKHGVKEDGYAGLRAGKFILDLMSGNVQGSDTVNTFDYMISGC